MNQKNKRTLIISTIACIILSFTTLIISKLKNSNADMYILLYVIAILLNIVLNFGLSIKVASTNGAKSLIFLGKWIMPITGVVYLIPQFYSLLFPEQDITEAFIYVFVGIMFIISGIAQILLCDRSANYSISWRCSIGLFTLSLFQKKEEHLI